MTKREDTCFNKYDKCVRVHCKCGKVMYFYRNHSMECSICGRLVYPTKESEFKEKMKIKLRKELSKNEKKFKVFSS